MPAYLTIQEPSQARLTVKMSRFLAFAWPVDSLEEAKARVAELQHDYHDARHVCYAWVLGPTRAEQFSTDAGEPSGTAGKPILGQINSRGLTNVVVGVVRYFGGIKLGTPGLIAAYKESAAGCLDAASVVERHEMRTLEVQFPYAAMNDVMTLAKQPGIKILGKSFDNLCSLRLLVTSDQAPELESRLRKAGATL